MQQVHEVPSGTPGKQARQRDLLTHSAVLGPQLTPEQALGLEWPLKVVMNGGKRWNLYSPFPTNHCPQTGWAAGERPSPEAWSHARLSWELPPLGTPVPQSWGHLGV